MFSTPLVHLKAHDKFSLFLSVSHSPCPTGECPLLLPTKTLLSCEPLPLYFLLSKTSPAPPQTPLRLSPPKSVNPLSSFTSCLFHPAFLSSLVATSSLAYSDNHFLLNSNHHHGEVVVSKATRLMQLSMEAVPHFSKKIKMLYSLGWPAKKGLQICPFSVEFTSVRNMNTRVKGKYEQ